MGMKTDPLDLLNIRFSFHLFLDALMSMWKMQVSTHLLKIEERLSKHTIVR